MATSRTRARAATTGEHDHPADAERSVDQDGDVRPDHTTGSEPAAVLAALARAGL